MPRKPPVPKAPLFRLIAERIQQNGVMPIAEYMGLALGHPEYGYYMTQNPFGVDGDFTTAPEISQLFGEMIALWFVDIWEQTGKPAHINFIELGAGRGTLSADILRVVSKYFSVSLHLVETSPRLRKIQAEALKKYKPVFYDSFNEVPEGFFFLVANEFFDALPIHQFCNIKGQWMERGVDYDAVKECLFLTLTGSAPVFESSPLSISIIEEIAGRIAEQGGAALVVDYGHVDSSFGDTLQAVAKHGYSNLLENVGEKDITAHVDFGALKRSVENQVDVSTVVTQGEFLLSLGIALRAEKLNATANEKQRVEINTAVQRLTHPSEMGQLFKVMGLTPKDKNIVPLGFGEVSE
jgi:NADH dehydrogenase [ubiquinone] 1 alpha subcomplex assembly factor 7